MDLTNRRLVVAYNPHSSRSIEVSKRVFERLNAAGYEYETLEVKQASLEENVLRLKRLIKHGDVILSAAGDGSARAIACSVIAANQKDVAIGFLAYGNFNDLPHAFNSRAGLKDPVALLNSARTERVFPLKIEVDDEPERYSLLYTTVGWTAEAAKLYDNPAIRSHVGAGNSSLTSNLWRLGLHYLKTFHSSCLPEFTIGGAEYKRVSDLLFVNGPTLARLFRNHSRSYIGDTFLVKRLNVANFMACMPFIILGLLGRMPGKATREIKIVFNRPATIPMQCDGEVVELQNTSTLVVSKSAKPINILISRSDRE